MLLLVTIGLVVVGAVALVIGFVSNSLGPIYLSIACSVIAGIVLVVFSRMARRGDAGGATAAPASASPGSWSPSAASSPAPGPTPTMTTTFEPAPSRPVPAPRAEPAPTIAMREPDRAAVTTMTAPPGAATDGDDFPISGYDTLRASQIVAQLGDLDLDELDMVQEREEQSKNRATVLRKVAERIDQLEAEDGAGAPLAEEPASAADFPAAAAADFPAATEDDFPAESEDDGFPIADYDQLSVEEIVAVLDDLEDEELDMVAEREEQGRNRVEILDYIDEMFEEVDGAEPESARAAPVVTPPPVAAKRAPAKKAPTKAPALAKRAPAKKATAAPAGRKAAPVAKTPARKAATGKAAAAKAPAANAPAARATGKRSAASPGTKAAGRKAAAPVAKAAKAPAKVAATRGPAKKAAATKVPAKKAAATRKR